jgi:hypothetical protein
MLYGANDYDQGPKPNVKRSKQRNRDRENLRGLRIAARQKRGIPHTDGHRGYDDLQGPSSILSKEVTADSFNQGRESLVLSHTGQQGPIDNIGSCLGGKRKTRKPRK